MVIVLHCTDASPPARAVYMTAHILGLELDKREVFPLRGETRTPEFLELNPTHTIPVIQDKDFTLSDSHAIITYLVSKYGAEKRATLYPVDLRTRATVDHRLFLDTSLLFTKIPSLVKSIVLEKVSQISPQLIEEVNESYGFLEKYLERSEYLAGEHITLADISCVSSVSSLDTLVPISEEKFPKLVEWYKKIQVHDWYIKGNLPGVTIFGQLLNAALEKNASG